MRKVPFELFARFATLLLLFCLSTVGFAQDATCLKDGGTAHCPAPMPGDWACYASMCFQPGAASQPGCSPNVIDTSQACHTRAEAWAFTGANLIATGTYTYRPGGGLSCSAPVAGCSRHVEPATGVQVDPTDPTKPPFQGPPPCDHCHPERAGDPVQPASGDQSLAELDIAGSSEVPLEFMRYYSSSVSAVAANHVPDKRGKTLAICCSDAHNSIA